MQARATLFSFSHFVAHFLSKVATPVQTVAAQVAAAGVSIHATVLPVRLSLMSSLTTAGRQCHLCVRIVNPSIALENQHRKSDCSPVVQNNLETFLAFVAVHGQRSWVLLSTEHQTASLLVT